MIDVPWGGRFDRMLGQRPCAESIGVISTEVPIRLGWKRGWQEADYTFAQFRSLGLGTDTSDEPDKVGFTQAVGDQWNGLRPSHIRKP